MNKPKSKKKKKPLKSVAEYKSDILNFFLRKSDKGFSQKEVSQILKVNKTNYHNFHEAFEEMRKDHELIRISGKKFKLAGPGQEITGKLMLTRRGFGFVEIEESSEEIFIPTSHINNAFDGDLVKVKVFPTSRGKSKEGQILSIEERARTNFVGVYHKSAHYGFVVADSQKVAKDFYIGSKNCLDAKDGQKVVVEFLSWEKNSLNPEGKIIEILGFPDEPGVDVVSVVKGFNLPLEFPPKVEEEARKIKLELTPEIMQDRMDLRDELIFTIDPIDAKDFDDAISLKKLDNGNLELGVHIADVSTFVQEGSALDKEALNRGTSIYLVDRVVPMLPEELSTDICSLQPNQPRLTFSCIMEVNSDCKVVDYTIQPSVIESKRRFNYQEVQQIIDDENSSDELAAHLREVRDFGMKLRDARTRKGSIDFETPEVRFVLNEKGKPVEIVPIVRLQSHMLIEEFMLLANQTVSEHIKFLQEKGKIRPFVYRVHERPDVEKIEKFTNFLKALGHNVAIPKNVTPKKFQEILESVLGSKDDILIKEVALRTMMKAVYSPKNIGHFGLAFEDYTHFTSPIRRYPDLIVHRLLKLYTGSVGKEKIGVLKESLKSICQRCSERERVALEAERESIKLKQVEWIAEHVDSEFSGIISGVTARGLFVEITPTLIEGFVNLEDIYDDYYIFNEKTYSIHGKESGKQYRLGDEVKIKVHRVDLETRLIDFLLVLDEEN